MAGKKEKKVEEKILDNSLEDIVADRFARYSKYIIQERALPDARDGLKPVQRRILFAMQEAGNTYSRPYHKSAKTVGNVIGNYHPHGDSSVYDALVRMSQPWKINQPLIDMQGNNGSIDDDPAAAMRYTECRLSHLSDYLLKDIEKNTVEWAPNFSDEKLEPTLLPAAYPNLLCHGITGIAAGYATNIPPHNLSEVIDGCIYRIQHPSCSLADLMERVQGPDFPTGGTVLGLEGIRDAFENGKGKIFIRAKAEIVQTRTIQQILITEIPYEVVKSSLVKRIDDLRIANNFGAILEVRDESGREGLQIAIDLKKDAPAQEILNFLYKNSDLQVSYTYNMVAIVNQSPKLLSLPAALDAFIAHREIIIERRSQFELEKARNRAHILEGLIKAVSILDEIIALIRASKDKADSKKRISKAYGFSEVQAEAIVSMRLYTLSSTDIQQLREEAAALEKTMSELEKILKSRKVLHSLMIKELRQIQKEFGQPRKTQISSQDASVSVDPLAMIPSETVMLSVSKDGYIKRSSMRSFSTSSQPAGGLKENDVLVAAGEANTRENLLFFTDKGKYGYLPVYSFPEVRWKEMGTHLSSLIRLDQNEKVVYACLFDSLSLQSQLLLATRKGQIKRLKPELLQVSRMNKAMTAINLTEDDALCSVDFSRSSAEQVYLTTHAGYGLRFPVRSIPLSGLKSKGVRGMNVMNNDTLVTIGAFAREEQVLLWQQNGYFKRLPLNDYAAASRASRGSRLFKTKKSAPDMVEGLYFVQPHDLLPFTSPVLSRKQANSVPLSTPSGGFSSVVHAEEPLSILPKLEHLPKGSWTEEDDQRQQPLFEVENV